MEDKNTGFFKKEDHFKETEHIPSIPVFENHLQETPKFTIAIPTYKRAKYLKEAVDSALHQDTKESYEIIVVDNNPEVGDETEKLMDDYSSVPNLSYYKNSENLGMVGNWNRLYILSRSEWVIMLHDDDRIQPNFISHHLRLINKVKNIAFIFPSWYSDQPSEKDSSYYYQLRINKFLIGNIVGPPIGMFALRRSLIELGGFRQYLYPSIDLDLYIRALYNNYKCIKVVGPSTAWYRIEVNESLKQEVALGFLDNHLEIESILLSRENSLVAKYYEGYIKELRVAQFRQWVKMVKDNNQELLRLQQLYQAKSNRFSKFCYKFHHLLLKIQRKISYKKF